MEEAIKRTQELLNENYVYPEQKQEHKGRLKSEINNLLHQFLPGDISLDEAEVLSMVIFEIICDPNKFLGVDKNKQHPEVTK